MEFNDVLGLGKVLPIDKLMDIVSKSVGKISKPYFDRKDVDTKAYEIRKLAEARADEVKIMADAIKENFPLTGGIEYRENKICISSPLEVSERDHPFSDAPALGDRMQDRLYFQEAKKQLNIESITSFAAEELKDEQPITNEPINEDWATRFFRIAEDISNEEMQAVWGKILAGEIKQPKSFSLRTLELIRTLSKTEADIFIKVAKLAVKSGGKYYIFHGNNEQKLRKDFDVHYSDIALLTEIGIIQPGTLVHLHFETHAIDRKQAFIAGNIVLIVSIKANTKRASTPVDVFSTAGNELIKLVKTSVPMEYLRYIAESIEDTNIDVSYANIITCEGDNICHTLPQKFH